ncbi:unnamed protein product, partial [Hapterophycus canaliculatus]
MLDRLEKEAQHKQEALRRRIDEESVEVKATMTFSRASAVKSVEQEIELRKAREAEEARLRSQKEEQAAVKEISPNATKPTKQRSLSLSLPEPELEREDAEDDHRRLVEENQRLNNDNKRLVEEASSLRARGEEARRLAQEEASLLRAKEEGKNERLAAEVCSLREQVKGCGGDSSSGSSSSGSSSSEPCIVAAVIIAGSAPGSPADVQQPTTPSPEEEVSGVASVSSHDEEGVPGSGLGSDVSSVTKAGDGSPVPESADHLQLVLFETVPSPSRRRRVDAATGHALAGDGSGGSYSNYSSNSSNRSSRDDSFGSGREGCRREREEDRSPRRERAELERWIEIEAERVYTELRANPPPSIKALLAAREEMDGLAAEARSTLK